MIASRLGAARLRAPVSDGTRHRMRRAALQRRRHRQHPALVDALDRDHLAERRACPRSACRSCRRSAYRPAQGLERLARSDQHAGVRAAAGRHHHRHRRREPERTRAGDDQHRDRRHQSPARDRALRPSHATETHQAIATTSGTNQLATLSASAWIGARLRCAVPTSATIWLSRVSAPDAVGPHHEAALAVERAAGHRVTDAFCGRQRLAGEHRFIDHSCRPRSPRRRPAPPRRAGRAAGRRRRQRRAARRARARRCTRRAVFGARLSSARIDLAGLLAGPQFQHLPDETPAR